MAAIVIAGALVVLLWVTTAVCIATAPDLTSNVERDALLYPPGYKNAADYLARHGDLSLTIHHNEAIAKANMARAERLAQYSTEALIRDVLWVSNPGNWLSGAASVPPQFQYDPNFGKGGDQSPFLAHIRTVRDELPSPYWSVLRHAVSKDHFYHLLGRAREHIQVARRLQEAGVQWLLLNVTGSAGLLVAAFGVPWALRRRRRQQAVVQHAAGAKQRETLDEWIAERASGLAPQLGASAVSGPPNGKPQDEKPQEAPGASERSKPKDDLEEWAAFLWPPTPRPMGTLAPIEASHDKLREERARDMPENSLPAVQDAHSRRTFENSTPSATGAPPRTTPTVAPMAKVAAEVVGFLAGFFGVGALLLAFFYSAHLQPRGAGWLFLLVGAGVVGSRVAAYFADADNLRRMGGQWWELDRTFRLVLVVGAVWAVTLFLLLEEVNLKVVLLPPLALVVLFFAYRHLVDAPGGPRRPEGSRDEV